MNEIDETDTSKEIADCDDKESDCEIAFSSERLSCFPHTLQLVVSKFDEVRACKEAISKSKKIVARVNKSTEM